MSAKDFSVVGVVDSAGTPERQLTMTMPAQVADYGAGKHRFELSTPSGARHEMFFSATVERAGANLRLRVRLTNAADQLALPLTFEDEINTAAQAGKGPARKVRRRKGNTPDPIGSATCRERVCHDG